MVESAFLRVGLEELSALCDEHAPADVIAAQRAAACVAQWKTVTWSRLQTTTRHVAPDTETLATHFESIRALFADGFRPRGWLGAAGARKRGTRLRLRWGGRCGVMRRRETVPVAERQEKAHHESSGI